MSELVLIMAAAAVVAVGAVYAVVDRYCRYSRYESAVNKAMVAEVTRLMGAVTYALNKGVAIEVKEVV